VASEAKPAILIPEEIRLGVKLGDIFMPYAADQRKRLYPDDHGSAKFVHYTSADAALNIIGSKRFWMRNTTCMSDYREVQHGVDIFRRFFSVEDEKRLFCDALDIRVPGAAGDALASFDEWCTPGPSGMRLNTYITSLSEHDESENAHGRLSMWRAFGGSNVARVAIVLKIPFYTGAATFLNVRFSPVAYSNEAEVHASLRAVVRNVHANGEFLRSFDRSQIAGMVVLMLITGVSCLKHEGFREEREWRAVYNPNRMSSPHMLRSTKVLSGIPQTVYEFPIDKTVCDELSGLDLSLIFDRLIIGPSPYPWVIYEAFVNALSDAGIENAHERVFTSGIPLRA
jgi:hypothetical protein